jgi:hypothetical protein
VSLDQSRLLWQQYGGGACTNIHSTDWRVRGGGCVIRGGGAGKMATFWTERSPETAFFVFSLVGVSWSPHPPRAIHQWSTALPPVHSRAVIGAGKVGREEVFNCRLHACGSLVFCMSPSTVDKWIFCRRKNVETGWPSAEHPPGGQLAAKEQR